MEVATIPFEAFTQILVYVWTAAGLPVVFGVLISKLTEYVKNKPTFLPLVTKGKVYAVRGFVALSAVLVQVVFNLLSGEPVTLQVAGDAFLTYLAASAAYTHLFKIR